MLSKFLTEEAPGKVLALVGASLFSLAFLFAVSATDANFGGTNVPLPNTFNPEKVIAVIDNAAAAYSSFLSANFLQPLASDYKVYGENLAWLSEQSGITNFFGLEGSGQSSLALRQAPSAITGGQVAGAQTFGSNSGTITVDDLYNILIR